MEPLVVFWSWTGSGLGLEYPVDTEWAVHRLKEQAKREVQCNANRDVFRRKGLIQGHLVVSKAEEDPAGDAGLVACRVREARR